MSEAVELLTNLNSDWRVVVLPAAPWRRSKAWCLQRRVAGDWQGMGIVRSAAMLRELVLGRAGAVAPHAAAVLAALPPRVDVRLAVKAKPVAMLAARPPRVHIPAVLNAKPVALAQAARVGPVASIAPEVVRIPAKPDSVHDAAERERIAIKRARVHEERARAEERYWRGIIK
ncbi:hypothetical protein QCM80_22880 [Bradyrhizobium sp. SSUT112]|uniref:hypothetical protein n=1 Tax=Bradyrhizobium sp. SSUT112 TaxID=3040604 RepID=UPI002448F33B|nr:hypothetical protein [Bradyrhizobium sp. SSUT112]MDH2353483.1 hypothetical protein [Bradyrhizobium sp. SSUT112]